MNECKCGRIPPCYGGKKFRIHEELEEIKPCSEETAQGIIEALRELRNASELEEAGNRLAEHIFEDILKSIKSNDMEEKKTKKMTKAEAFEWLKCKKVSVPCREITEKVQSKLFACGIQWLSGGTDFCDYSNYYIINSHGRLGFCDGSSFWENLINEEISADDILSIEIVEGTPVFSYDKVVELAKPLMKYLNDTGCTEQIGVSYDHIVAQPMAIILHGEMKGC